jgi:hypothetical protein
MNDFRLRRLRMLMELQPGNLQEVMGVLNPATVRGYCSDPYFCELPSRNPKECAL